MESRNASAKKMPPHHQLAFVNRLPAWRVPRNELAELLTPPNVAAMPPPCPAWSSTAAMRTTLSITRRTSRRVYSIDGSRVRLVNVSPKYHDTYVTPSSVAHRRPNLGVEARATHQQAVDSRCRQQSAGVRSIHTPAIENRRIRVLG